MKLGPLGLAKACALLALAVAVLFPAVAYFAYVTNGIASVEAAGIAAGVCWISAMLALVITWRVRYAPQGVYGMLLAMVPRMVIPLAVGLVLDQHGGRWAQAGVFGWIVVFYLATLAVETVLSLMVRRRD